MKDAKQIYKIAESQGYVDKEKWQREAYENRFQNLFLSMIFVGGAATFFLIGLLVKKGFFSPVHRYILMGFSGILFLIGMITLINYIILIIRGRKS